MKSTLEVAGLRVPSGSKEPGSIQVASLHDAAPVEVPFGVINGAADGPIGWIHGGLHGDEYVGPAAIQSLWAGVDPASLAGALVLLPVVNILAYRERRRSTLQDGLDMNRVWPGAPLESAGHIYAHTEIVVACLVELIRSLGARFAVDCHSGGCAHLMSPHAVSSPGTARAEALEMALVARMGLVWECSTKFDGASSTNLTRAGIPAIALEAGGQARVDPQAVQVMRRGLLNIIRHFGMLPGQAEGAARQILIRRGHWLRAPHGGMLCPLVRPGQMVQAGAPFARITDLMGEEVALVRAPHAGVVLGHRDWACVNSGEYVGNVSVVEGHLELTDGRWEVVSP